MLGLAGCGSSAGGGTLDAATAGALQSDLAAVRADATRGERGPALTALSAFAARVASAAHSGRLTAGEQTALDTGIARLRASLETRAHGATATTPATARTTTTTIIQPAAPAAPAVPPGHDKGKKHGGGGGGGDGQGEGGD